MMKIISVVGARPNFMKIAPIVREIDQSDKLENVLVHTGQHYDEKMSDAFFSDLGIPAPDYNLNVGSGSHAKQTAEVMLRFEKVIEQEKPHLVLVVGDVNSTLACSIVAAKLNIAVAHVEAGLRSFDRKMPEEINRIVTDAVSDLFFITSPEAEEYLLKEGSPKERIHYVGNVMIDTLMYNLEQAEFPSLLEDLNISERKYALVTIHRPSNVDDPDKLKSMISALVKIQEKIPVVFPVHPRTKKNIDKIFPQEYFQNLKQFHLMEPLGYLTFLSLMKFAQIVVTDSGGIQEETTALGVPCLTVRENTERPITITEGTNHLVGTSEDKILETASKIISGHVKSGKCPKYWDGKASKRIIRILESYADNLKSLKLK
jgi:UDP-N-acetylglucosamine 2-epimerase (non-hydrolysing)